VPVERRAASRAACGTALAQRPHVMHEAAIVTGHDFPPGGWLYWAVHVSPEAFICLEYSRIMALRKSRQRDDRSVSMRKTGLRRFLSRRAANVLRG
jgi:hypothetical protein